MISAPCIVDMPNDDYHSCEGISSSGLKLLDTSPLHYWERYLNPEREPDEKSPALIFGTQLHTYILEPKLFTQRYSVMTFKPNMRTNAGKEEMAEFEARAAAEGKELITIDNYTKCLKIGQRVRNCDAASFLFEYQGMIEQSFFWTDPETGVLCKCRPDKFMSELGIVLDLKSSQSAAPADFQRAVWNYGYHLSAAYYLRGVEAVTGERPKSFIFAAFEPTAPYASAYYEADMDMIAYADREVTRLLRKFAECQQSGEWAGYPQKILQIGLPPWAVSRIAKGE